jgi:hypothetical protein
MGLGDDASDVRRGKRVAQGIEWGPRFGAQLRGYRRVFIQ